MHPGMRFSFPFGGAGGLRPVTDVTVTQVAQDQIDFTWDPGVDVGGDNAYDVETEYRINAGAWTPTTNSYIASDAAGTEILPSPLAWHDLIRVRVRRVHAPDVPSNWTYSDTIQAFYAAGSVEFTVNDTWTAPFTGNVAIECWGGGGAGGTDTGSKPGGGGGGGSYVYYDPFPVSLNDAIPVVVAAGGIAGGEINGGDSYIGIGTSVLAQGGTGSVEQEAGIGGGGSSIGTSVNSGGDGAAGNGGAGGGGGGAGDTGSGSAGAGSIGGAGGTNDGGVGGDGGADPQPGGSLGGGGGGKDAGGGVGDGANGAAGKVRISWSAQM